VKLVPLFWAKKEVYHWLKDGEKTVDVRKGNAIRGSIATFQCGPFPILKFPIIKTETGLLSEVIREDNFKKIIPTAKTLKDAIDYLHSIYGKEETVFTAYYITYSKP
jgi:ASC-1-like (ASCH) protein